MTEAAMRALCDDALAGRRVAIAQLTSLLEREDLAAMPLQSAAVAHLRQARPAAAAHIIGLTGAPGVGKSSLIAAMLAVRGETAAAGLRIAVLAVDPASEHSGGSLLGDRTRGMSVAADEAAFFRSQSAGGALGGLAAATASVIRLWAYLFDAIVVETVGVGQSEAEITRVAGESWLVLQPSGGDQLQFLKAGLMERVNRYVLNKADLPGAKATSAQLRAVPGGREVSLVSCQDRAGVAALWPFVLASQLVPAGALEPAILTHLCVRELGRGAGAVLAAHGGAQVWAAASGGAEAAWLSHLHIEKKGPPW